MLNYSQNGDANHIIVSELSLNIFNRRELNFTIKIILIMNVILRRVYVSNFGVSGTDMRPFEITFYHEN